MKKWGFIVFALAVAFLFTACGHTHVWEEATCTTPKTCSVCGETEGEAPGHVWKEATCTTAQTCSVCNEIMGVHLGHLVESWTILKEPTCTLEGEKSGVCSRCGVTVEAKASKLDHTPGEWVITKKASLTEEGERTQSCTVCGEVVKTESFALSEEERESAYKSMCKAYSYDTIARDPNAYKDTYAKYTGEIIQVLEDGNSLNLRVNITKNSYGWYSDTIYVVYTLKDGESRLLEDDIVTIYGKNAGTISYESILGATITLPSVNAEYIDLH